jgi:hypothetical protein
MAKKNGFWGMLAMVLAFGTVLIGCATATAPEEDTPSDVTSSGEDHWSDSVMEGSTVTLERSIDAQGLNTVIVSGNPNPEEDWYAQVGYNNYKAEPNSRYKYTFKVWTDSGTAKIRVVARPERPNGDEASTQLKGLDITTAEQTFSLVTRTPLGSGEKETLNFILGGVTGTFYIQVISVEKTDELASGNWWDWREDGSTLALERSINAEGVLKVIVSGAPVAVPNPGGDPWQVYSLEVGYNNYKAEPNSRYKYTFKIWTDSGTARIPVVTWPGDRIDNMSGLWVDITTVEQTYLLVTKFPLNSEEEENLRFWFAGVTGTFYIQVISIEKTDEPGTNN